VVLADGTRLAYDQLALTTGSNPRALPAAVGGALAGIFAVRRLSDIDAMAPRFVPGARLVIVGGGYIGLEAAAVAADAAASRFAFSAAAALVAASRFAFSAASALRLMK
jgi:3-phenylpropionate/trans-cinnamate dioxygenase ferredoxin reductase subunit